MLRVQEKDIKCHAKYKDFPNGKRIIYAASEPIFCEDGWELSNKWDSKKGKKKARKDSEQANILRSKRRAAANLKDIALCNDFKYFVTLTLDGGKIDRYDLSAVVTKLNSWLDNRVRRKGLKYVLVPEEHKDGAFHFHGFFNDALSVVDSGTLSVPGCKRPRKPRSARERERLLTNGAKVVYNLYDWDFGFSTAIELYGEREAAISYTTKYITKAERKLGGRWFFSGGQLEKPKITVTDDLSFRDIAEIEGAYVIEMTFAGYALAILETYEGNFEQL